MSYEITRDLPETERFGLVSQIRRASVSIAANIAEGAGRGTDAQFAHFLRCSLGSLNELETLVMIANDVGLLAQPVAAFDDQARDLGVKLRNLVAKIEADLARKTTSHAKPS